MRLSDWLLRPVATLTTIDYYQSSMKILRKFSFSLKLAFLRLVRGQIFSGSNASKEGKLIF